MVSTRWIDTGTYAAGAMQLQHSYIIQMHPYNVECIERERGSLQKQGRAATSCTRAQDGRGKIMAAQGGLLMCSWQQTFIARWALSSHDLLFVTVDPFRKARGFVALLGSGGRRPTRAPACPRADTHAAFVHACLNAETKRSRIRWRVLDERRESQARAKAADIYACMPLHAPARPCETGYGLFGCCKTCVSTVPCCGLSHCDTIPYLELASSSQYPNESRRWAWVPVTCFLQALSCPRLHPRRDLWWGLRWREPLGGRTCGYRVLPCRKDQSSHACGCTKCSTTIQKLVAMRTTCCGRSMKKIHNQSIQKLKSIRA